MSKVIVIIPARGGSKRIIKKNIKEFHGTPMIQRTIQLAKESGLFSEIVVSTDDQEISRICQLNEVNLHRRDAELSDDFTTTVEVVSNILLSERYKALSSDTIVVCLYPVTPLLQPRRISEAINYLQESNATYIFPVHEFDSPVERGFKLSQDNHPRIFFQKKFLKRTQDSEPTFHDAGQFYVANIETWRTKKPILSKFSRGLKLAKYETVDVDNQEDWEFAEELYLIRERQERSKKRPQD
jgi:pseudaminic acid cytidylyltransferase